MVAENKSLPGREERRPGEALGRPLSVAFFEKVEDVADGAPITSISIVSFSVP